MMAASNYTQQQYQPSQQQTHQNPPYYRQPPPVGGVYPAGAAILGLAEDAAKLLRPFYGQQHDSPNDKAYRGMQRCCCGVYGQPSLFPAFWSSSDGTPAAEHSAMVRIAVHKMLVQSEGRRILLLPAWPAKWACSFRLNVPFRTTITGRVLQNGTLATLNVLPLERRADVTIVTGQPLPPQSY